MGMVEAYTALTQWKYDPIQGRMPTDPNLARMVDPAGRFLPTPGLAAVFRPGKFLSGIISLMKDMVYEQLEESHMLADPLPASSLHMTVHEMAAPGGDVRESLETAQRITEEIRRVYAGRRIVLHADRIVNMLSGSLALLLEPEGEEDWNILTDIYRRYDRVVPLPYPLTPHITLAYFRPGMLDGDRLGEAVRYMQVEGEKLDFAFDMDSLTVQRYTDLTDFRDVPFRICFVCDGGMHRSQMAAAMVNHMARERGLPVLAEARAAYQGTEGKAVPESVRNVLKRHGMELPDEKTEAAWLGENGFGAYSSFAAISPGAVSRLQIMRLEEARCRYTELFLGVQDPSWETTYEEAFQDLYRRVSIFLDEIQEELRAL